ncbi:MAG: PEP-CTERM sorting domain-containing protein [Candidatus Omnitrophica bacterium]|nr:PEP-CTERM sorting domain-containing protein [Candidatus Omnitrophota bacterium]
MKKGILIGCVVLLFVIFSFTGQAFAIDTFYIHTTDGDQHTDTVDTFGWNETPWLRIHLPREFLNATASWWQSPSSSYFFTGTGPGTAPDLWLSLDSGQSASGDPVNWASVRALGLWTINAAGYFADNDIYSGVTSFTVTPEPVSGLLFLLGGLALVGARKKSA